ncbi:MAG: hypothetical protein WC901_00730 [Candidatus Margulisiibacteriota bacterium]
MGARPIDACPRTAAARVRTYMGARGATPRTIADRRKIWCHNLSYDGGSQEFMVPFNRLLAAQRGHSWDESSADARRRAVTIIGEDRTCFVMSAGAMGETWRAATFFLGNLAEASVLLVHDLVGLLDFKAELTPDSLAELCGDARRVLEPFSAVGGGNGNVPDAAIEAVAQRIILHAAFPASREAVGRIIQYDPTQEEPTEVGTLQAYDRCGQVFGLPKFGIAVEGYTDNEAVIAARLNDRFLPDKQAQCSAESLYQHNAAHTTAAFAQDLGLVEILGGRFSSHDALIEYLQSAIAILRPVYAHGQLEQVVAENLSDLLIREAAGTMEAA